MAAQITEQRRQQLRQAGRRGGLKRAKAFTSEYQRTARSCVKRESLVRAGQNGYRATKARCGEGFAARLAAAYRRANPSLLEQRVMDWLDELGVGSEYEREVEVQPGVFPDFVFERQRLVIECDGWAWHSHAGPHGEDREGHDRARESALRMAGYRIVRLPEAAILDGSARAQLIQALRMAQVPFRDEIPF